ncbi:MAG: YqgE/AlgH family protein [Myxococcales bacterium]|nr:YqgE/AlgH family protein [Myxococcales bacterium]
MTKEQLSIAPGLLIAMPQLLDPNFRRSVVLMLEHNDDGSFGVVLNNPIHETVTIHNEAGEAFSVTDHLYLGGPVSPQVGLVVHGDGWRGERTHEIMPGLCVSEPSQAIPRLLELDSVPYRFVVGYSGWGPKQLENELAYGSWLTSSTSADFIFDRPAVNQWEEAIRALGIDPIMLVPSSDIQ